MAAAASQVAVELAVREAGAGAVGEVHGEGGLAHAGPALDRDQRGGGAVAEMGEQVRDERAAPGQVRHVGGQQADGERGTHHDRPRYRHLRPVHRRVQPAQLRTRLAGRLLVDGERVGRPAGPGQGEHQLGAQPFPGGMFGHQRAQLADQVGVPPGGQLGVDAVLGDGVPLLGEPAQLGREGRDGDVGQRFTAPPAEGGPEPYRRARVLAFREALAAGVNVGPELGQVERGRVEVQPVGAVAVPDVEGTLQKIESAGGKRLFGPMEVPEGPTIAHFADPEGHVVGLFARM